MIVFQNEHVIVHEVTNTKDILNVEGASFQAQPGDWDKYSEESKLAMAGRTWLWYNGYATGFTPEGFYIIEYLTGDYIGVGVDSKSFVERNIIARYKSPEIEHTDGTKEGDKNE